MMIYYFFTIGSLFLNAFLIVLMTSNWDIEVNFDKVNSVNLRLAEQEYLSEPDKVSIIAKLIDDLDSDKLEEWQKNGLKNKVLDKFTCKKKP